ncbi:uncharacterized protein J3R85_018052 [Psidium guajava]|nr:uncharacterized protein J3R85_018052 [Psidium guajava]
MNLPRHKAILCISLLSLSLFFHGCCGFFSRHGDGARPDNQLSWSNRRALASRYDFTPYLRHRHRQRHQHRHHHQQQGGHAPLVPGPPDPLYGSDKRFVPSGPNPLHH